MKHRRHLAVAVLTTAALTAGGAPLWRILNTIVE